MRDQFPHEYAKKQCLETPMVTNWFQSGLDILGQDVQVSARWQSGTNQLTAVGTFSPSATAGSRGAPGRPATLVGGFR